MWTGNAIHFEKRRYPGKGYGVAADAVMHFEMGVFGVDAGMQGVIQG